ncbi:hypothetical protein ADUPG1_004212, partial [Aduncisulcus paluster]
VAKKTIFEKLGLIEPVEGEAPETTEVPVGSEDENILEEKVEEKAVEEEPVAEEPPAFGFDLLAAKNEPLNKDEFGAKPVVAPAEPKAEDVKQIEDKLDVLIGSYEKNKMLSIDDIYRNSRMEADKKKTIFMVDVFQKT